MDAGLWLAAGSLVVLAFAHSALGEAMLLRPLFASADFPRLAVPRQFVTSTLRFAWHLTSLAWLALAWVVVRASEQTVLPVAVLLLVSGAITHLATRGQHFAWAIFVLGGLGGLHTAGLDGRVGVALGGASALAAIGVLHVAWAFGLRWGLEVAIPSRDGQPLFRPPALLTLGVAAGLFGMAAVLASLGGWLPALPFARWIGVAAAVVFAARTLGDLRTAGLFKRERASAFARMDSLLYTPLTFGLSAAFAWVL